MADRVSADRGSATQTASTAATPSPSRGRPIADGAELTPQLATAAGEIAKSSAKLDEQKLWARAATLSGSAPSSATSAVPYRLAQEASAARLRIIAQAKETVLASVYFLAPDQGGIDFVNALTAAASAGKKVIFSRDGIAKLAGPTLANRSAELEAAVEKLRAAGGTVLTFGGVIENLGMLGSGLHLKVLAADSDRALIGGRNIGTMFDDWPDFDVDYTGEVAAAIVLQTLPVFHRVVHDSGEGLLLGEKKRMELYATLADIERRAVATKREERASYAHGTQRYSVIISDPVALRRSFNPKENPNTQLLVAGIDAARSSITFSSNYVRPVPQIAAALKRAVERGVKVTAVTTGLSGSKLSTLSYFDAESSYNWLTEIGVHVVQTKKQEHAKLYILDERILLYGSYNVEPHADRLLVESLVMTDDQHIVDTARQALASTQALYTEDAATRAEVERVQTPLLQAFSHVAAFFLSPFL